MIGHPDERDVERWRTSDSMVMRAELDSALGLDAGSPPPGHDDTPSVSAPRRPTDRPRGRPSANVRPPDREPASTRWTDSAKDSSHHVSDAELIEAVRGGTTQAYGQLYTRHVHAAHNLARQLAKSPMEADDLVSDAFAKVLTALRAGGGPDVAFRPYLLTALRHTAYDKTRRDRKVELADDVEAIAGAEHVTSVPFQDTAVARLDQSLAVRAFESLPERWQTVLWHTAIEGQAPADVAPLLGLTPNSVSATAYRAREGLRKAYVQAHMERTPADRCRATATKLGSWTRNGLSKLDTAQVEAHLDKCADCRALAAELADVNATLRATVAPLVLGAGIAGYLAATAGKASAAASVAVSGSASLLPWLGAAASTAAVVIAVVTGVEATDSPIGTAPVNQPPASIAVVPTSESTIGQTNPSNPGATGTAAGTGTGTASPTAAVPSANGPSAVAPSGAAPKTTTSAATGAPALTPSAPESFNTSTGGPPTRLPITIRNTGSAPAPPMTLTLSLPDDVKVVGPGNNLLSGPLVTLNGAAQQTVGCPAGKGTVTCKADQELAPGASVTFAFRLLAGPKATGGTITAVTNSGVPVRVEIPVTITPKK